MQAFGSRNRKPKFQLSLRIIDLNNIPLVSGSSYVKWHLPHSTSAEHRGRTAKFPIRDHCVTYEYAKSLPVRLSVDKSNLLQETSIVFEVVQEYSGGAARGERILLGNVKINLAEYVDAGSDDVPASPVQGTEGTKERESEDEGVVRRYLMRDSKINSTLKIGIYMKLVEGDRNFIAPALKTAPVFGGIAGIIAGEQADTEDAGHLPSLSTNHRENAESQDLYRRNLAAFLNAQPGELVADECIEDIFSGGTGWGPNGPPSGSQPPTQHPSRTSKRDWSRARDRPRLSGRNDVRVLSSSSTASAHARDDDADRRSTSDSDSGGKTGWHERKHSRQKSLTVPAPMTSMTPPSTGTAPGGRSSIESSAGQLRASVVDVAAHAHHVRAGSGPEQRAQRESRNTGLEGSKGRRISARESVGQQARAQYELDEAEVREDLRSWVLPGEAVGAAAT